MSSVRAMMKHSRSSARAAEEEEGGSSRSSGRQTLDVSQTRDYAMASSRAMSSRRPNEQSPFMPEDSGDEDDQQLYQQQEGDGHDRYQEEEDNYSDYDDDEDPQEVDPAPFPSGGGNVVVIKTTEEKLREAERIIASEVYYINDVPENLSKISLVAFFFQLFQSMFLFLVASSSDVKWTLSVAYPDPDLSVGNDDTIKPSLKQIGTVSVLWLAPVVTLLSGIEHFSCVLFKPTYTYYIARHQNPFRWTEYTLSASLVKVIIAIQAGITDFHLLVCIFVLMALCIQDGATHEAVNAKARSENRPQNWRPYITSYIGWFVGWAIIWNYFIVYNSRGGKSGVVWAIMMLLFIVDSSFAVLFHLQWFKIGIFDDYINGEKAYIALSFTAKTTLVWLSVLNTLNLD